jgi:hypothetical protein
MNRSDDAYRPISWRQRLLIIALTAATVTGLWLVLLLRPGFHVEPIPGSERAPCRPGQTTACIGGQADIRLIPATTASSPASSAS